MQFSIALAGKGGTGKTTLAGLLVKYLIKKGKSPILAVDADSNANFNEVLGLPVTITLGEAREQMKTGKVPPGMTKDIFIEMKMEESVAEGDDFDLVVMGQPEGSGCYCAANTLLTRFLERLTDNYEYVVMDNEAGMEHISRLTTKNVDVLLIVSDASRRSLQAAGRIDKLSKALNIGVGKSFLVINQVQGPPDDRLLEVVKEEGLNLVGVIGTDQAVYDYDLAGTPTIRLPEDTQVVREAFAIFDKIMD
ncbi:MAG: AAA family ATPase [Proteobacteria bacterium]|nr:AAA family ATPase [Pseudomonadota bacterium]